jgi:hypothetical protein
MKAIAKWKWEWDDESRLALFFLSKTNKKRSNQFINQFSF